MVDKTRYKRKTACGQVPVRISVSLNNLPHGFGTRRICDDGKADFPIYYIQWKSKSRLIDILLEKTVKFGVYI
jgi:hypothetical protein